MYIDITDTSARMMRFKKKWIVDTLRELRSSSLVDKLSLDIQSRFINGGLMVIVVMEKIILMRSKTRIIRMKAFRLEKNNVFTVDESWMTEKNGNGAHLLCRCIQQTHRMVKPKSSIQQNHH